MQPTKDSFYIALRDRLVALNPLRTVAVEGGARPAIIVAENELVIPIDPRPDAFYIEWGGVQPVPDHGDGTRLLAMVCTISYHTLGSGESGVDRGRTLAALDTELGSILQPRHTPKRNFEQSPSVDLGTDIFWTAPAWGEISGGSANVNSPLAPRLERKANLKVFFFAEGSSL